MSVLFNAIGSPPIDLSTSSEFMEYYNTSNTFIKHIIDKEINNGHYNDPDFLKIFDNKDAVVIDGGANIGLFSLLLAKVCKKIFAIEPTTRHLDILKKLCHYNDISNIEYHEIAFNNYNGECTFIVDESNTTQNRISAGGTTVKCSTIYDFIQRCGEPKIDLLKIDIEGGEAFAILSDPTFDKCFESCDNVYIEMHPPFVNPIDIINRMSSIGYKIKFMNSEYLNNNLNILAFK